MNDDCGSCISSSTREVTEYKRKSASLGQVSSNASQGEYGVSSLVVEPSISIERIFLSLERCVVNFMTKNSLGLFVNEEWTEGLYSDIKSSMATFFPSTSQNSWSCSQTDMRTHTNKLNWL